jgi:hypothetical protein
MSPGIPSGNSLHVANDAFAFVRFAVEQIDAVLHARAADALKLLAQEGLMPSAPACHMQASRAWRMKGWKGSLPSSERTNDSTISRMMERSLNLFSR